MSATNTVESLHPTTDTAGQSGSGKSTLRLLVVDDEVSIREFIAEALDCCDYKVETAENGVIALEKLRSSNFDALLTDYRMPKGTGWELIMRMRSAGIHIPTVMMTGQSGELLAKHPDLQVNALVEKPFLIQELLDVLENVLQPEMSSTWIDLPSETPKRPAGELRGLDVKR
jgi:CheY-like chemotaxis protein